MAPERLLEPQENDPRSDLYALGAVAYYLLSGQEIYADVSAAHLLTRILQQAPAPLAQVASQPIPAEVERLIDDLLAREINQRPASAQVALDRLHGIATANTSV